MTVLQQNGNGFQRLRRQIEAQVPRKFLRDLQNRFRYGEAAPLSDMAIYPSPEEIRFDHTTGGGWPFLKARYSGRVLPGDWDQNRREIERNIKLRSCRMRWEQGADWAETPIYQKMLAQIARGENPDDCSTPEELAARYARLDRIFAETRSRGRLLNQIELPAYLRREHGATLIHIARDGSCLRAGGGNHRFAIARILNLPELPCQLGVIHPQALTEGHLTGLRHSRLTAGTPTASRL